MVNALQRVGILVTSGDFEHMGSGFIFHKDFPWNGIARFLYNNLPEDTEIIVADIGSYKVSGDVSIKNKMMIGTKFTEKQTHTWLSAVKLWRRAGRR